MTTPTFDTARYPKREQLVSDRGAEDLLEEIGQLAATAGVNLDAALAEGRAAIERARNFKRAVREQSEPAEAAVKRLARALGEGTLDLDAAMAQAARLEALASGTILNRAVRASEGYAMRHAFKSLQALDGDAILTECRRIVAATLEEVRSLRKPLAGIRNADEAIEGGAKVAQAWTRYTQELVPRYEAAHRLVARLRDFHWVQPLPLDAPYSRAGRPDLATDDRRAARSAGRPILELLDPVCDRWELGGPFTEAEARATARVVADARTAQQARHRPPSDGGRLPVAA